MKMWMGLYNIFSKDLVPIRQIGQVESIGNFLIMFYILLYNEATCNMNQFLLSSMFLHVSKEENQTNVENNAKVD
jgi:hypothetical protein